MTQEERLVAAILEKRTIESSELFNYLITNKALSKIESFKKDQAQRIFNKDKE